MLHDEATLVNRRLNGKVVATALAFQTAYVSARSPEGGKELMLNFIDSLTGE